MKLRIATILAAIMMIGTAGSASATTVGPIFVRADAQTAGAWIAYTANIQVRPSAALQTAVWPGGYTADSVFIQSGIIMPGSPATQPGEALLFAWATTNVNDTTVGPLPLTYVSLPNVTLYSWYTVELYRTGSSAWTFRYKALSDGVWHVQGTFTRATTIASFQIVTEYWAEAPGAFGTQAIQHAWVKSAGGSYGAVSMAWSANAAQCAVERIRSTTPSNAVFESGSFVQPCFKVLW